MKIVKLLLETFQSDHYIERKKDRLNILDIKIPPTFYSDYTREEVFSKLKKEVEEQAQKTLKAFESQSTRETKSTTYIAMPAINFYVKQGRNESPLLLYVKYRYVDKKGKVHIRENIGNVYVPVIRGNTLATLLLTRGSKASIEERLLDHLKNEKNENNPKINIVDNLEKSKYIVDLETVFGNAPEMIAATPKFDRQELNYEPRTDYRKDSIFTHDVYGKGKVISTSSGVKGTGDAHGRLDWVEVDFGKPYLKGGVLHKTRKIPNIYTKVYWDLHK